MRSYSVLSFLALYTFVAAAPRITAENIMSVNANPESSSEKWLSPLSNSSVIVNGFWENFFEELAYAESESSSITFIVIFLQSAITKYQI